MPYRHAYWYLAGLILFTIVGFWGSFFSQLGSLEDDVALRAHMHTWPALIWMVLLACQAWTIHSRRIDLHKSLGKAGFWIFPFVIAGLVAILDVSAKNYLLYHGHPFNILGPALLFQAGLPILVYLAFFHIAMANRRRVQLHAGYLMAMPILLIESPASRLLKSNLPSLSGNNGIERFQNILAAVEIGLWIAFVIALLIWFLDRSKRMPFLVVAGVSLVQIGGMKFMSDSAAVDALMLMIAHSSTWTNYGIGLLAGAFVSWLGWRAGFEGKRQ